MSGFTLVELLVVVSIIGLIAAILMPAVNGARESARKARCRSNLRQFGIGFNAQVDRFRGAFCSGAFDWVRDGAVTEVGWVADLIESGSPVGEMLCPSNPYQVSETFVDLLGFNPSSAGDCVNMAGSPTGMAPDGQPIVNPCRAIIDGKLAANSEERRQLVESEIFFKHYNTNYSATWYLVRSDVLLDAGGNLQATRKGCGRSLRLRNSTRGPLRTALIDAGAVSASLIPILADGAAGATLPLPLGPHAGGTPTVVSFTRGPVLGPSMAEPNISGNKSRNGADGWWAIWARQTRQDYRSLAPVHRGACNILFADGSVRDYVDVNGDGFLNNGFESSGSNGFTDSQIELPPDEVTSIYSLMDKAAAKTN